MKRDLDALQRRVHDVLVLGGGIAGAWACYEAATRGLDAALVEADDFGQATSWSSLKTAHGGLRHLQRLDIAGFRESTIERRALLRVAPRIVRPLTFAVPSRGPVDAMRFFLGGLANDVLSADRNHGVREDRRIGRSGLLDATAATRLHAHAFAGGSAFTWQDAQIVHTERLLMALLHAATDLSACAANHCRVESIAREADRFLVHATTPEGPALKVSARSLVNATGGSVGRVATLAGDPVEVPAMLRGINLVLDRELTPPETAIGARDAGGRFLFLVPWLGLTILGTQYDDGTRPVDALVDALLISANHAFPWADVTKAGIRVTHQGHVPGRLDGEPIYRSAILGGRHSRVATVLSAKYTTARALAERAIDKIAGDLGRAIAPSVSGTRPLTHARPLEAGFEARLSEVLEEEMARDDVEAVRGRLTEGARGLDGPAGAGSGEA
jgi:glycerol-3-phosphate dehydrogenase